MLTLLIRYQFTLAFALPGLGAAVVGVVLGARAIQLQVWVLLYFAVLFVLGGVYILMRAWDEYDREKKLRRKRRG